MTALNLHAASPANSVVLQRRQRGFLIAAVCIWAAVLVVTGILVAHNPVKRSVTPVYHEAVANWHLRHDLYAQALEFNYLPQFVFVFAPFSRMSEPIDDVIWRVFSVAVLGLGMFCLCRLIDRRRANELFFWATLVSVPASLGAIRNGQSTTLMAGLMMLAAAQLAHRHWWSASASLVIAVAAKPLALVMLMLTPLVYRPTLPRVVFALIILAMLPFAVARPEYVLEQLGDLRNNLAAGAAVSDHRFADLNGIMRTLDMELAPGTIKLISLLAAAATALTWMLGSRMLNERGRPIVLAALAAAYLMIFNPMNESNTYVLLATIGSVAGLWCAEARKQRVAGWIMLIGIGLIGILPEPLRDLAPHLSLWLKPVFAMIFIIALLMCVFTRRDQMLTEDASDLPNVEIVPVPVVSAAALKAFIGRALRAR